MSHTQPEVEGGGRRESASQDSPPPLWKNPSIREIWTRPAPALAHVPLTRFMGRCLLSGFRKHIIEIQGLEHIMPEHDPFIVAFNHNQKYEALLIPTALIMERHGHLLHFLADWNYRLIPIIGSFFRRSETITVCRKDAKPRFLNVFKPLFRHPLPALARAKLKLEEGRSVGIFPEGRINRDPSRLLPGIPGAARLSLETGAPIVPGGIVFPEKDPEAPIGDRDPMLVKIGEPLVPTKEFVGRRAAAKEVRAWHDRLMSELARLSGKTWEPRSQGEG